MSMRYEYQNVGYNTHPEPLDDGCGYEFDENCRKCEHYDYCKKCAEGYYDE